MKSLIMKDTKDDQLITQLFIIKKKTQKNDVETYIHPIPSDEFGLEEEYDVITLVYLVDGVLIDDMDAEVGNIEEKIGEDFAKYFEESNGDTIYFKNDSGYIMAVGSEVLIRYVND